MTDAAQWRTSVGDTWGQEWRRTDRSFAGVSRHLDAAILAVAPDAGAALDIGCGAGATSIALAAARPALKITGIDLSLELVAVARERAATLPNAHFDVADASDPTASIGDAHYDLAVSRHGVMFFADPRAAFARIRHTLKPGAPLVFSCFQAIDRNPWASEVAEAITGEPLGQSGDMSGPFAFADPRHVSAILAETGWRDASVGDVAYRYVAGEGADPVADATAFLTRIGPAARALATLPEADRPAARARLGELLERHVADGAVSFPAAAWIWTARAGDME